MARNTFKTLSDLYRLLARVFLRLAELTVLMKSQLDMGDEVAPRQLKGQKPPGKSMGTENEAGATCAPTGSNSSSRLPRQPEHVQMIAGARRKAFFSSSPNLSPSSICILQTLVQAALVNLLIFFSSHLFLNFSPTQPQDDGTDGSGARLRGRCLWPSRPPGIRLPVLRLRFPRPVVL